MKPRGWANFDFHPPLCTINSFKSTIAQPFLCLSVSWEIYMLCRWGAAIPTCIYPVVSFLQVFCVEEVDSASGWPWITLFTETLLIWPHVINHLNHSTLSHILPTVCLPEVTSTRSALDIRSLDLFVYMHACLRVFLHANAYSCMHVCQHGLEHCILEVSFM